MRAGDAIARGATQAVLLVAGGAVTAVAATLGVLYIAGALDLRTRQETVAERGAEVMPFDLEDTTHVFETTETGGVQKVVADDPTDEEQVSLVREHLREEAEAFRRGDLSDPAAIHGEEMPGLKELEAGAERIDVRYTELDDGAQIKFTTGDPALVSALHRWFDAQLSDHGNHAAEGGQSGADGRAGDHEQRSSEH